MAKLGILCLWQTALAGILIPAAAEDVRSRQIPKLFPLLLTVYAALRIGTGGTEAFLETFAGGLCFYCLEGGTGLGAGDIRLAAVGAWLLGPDGLLRALLLAGCGALLTHGRGPAAEPKMREIALGPWIAAGIWICAWFV